MLTFTGSRPASWAAAIPSRTFATGKSTPFIAEKTASSSESRLTVTRRRPASRSAAASFRRAEPFVVSVRSSSPPSGRRRAASIEMRTGRSRRTSGSPPVIRSFSTPSSTKARATRSISSKLSTSAFGRNAKSGPKISFGMQYVQRKLQRSVTEMRRSCNGLPRRSSTACSPGSIAGVTGPSYSNPGSAPAAARSGGGSSPRCVPLTRTTGTHWQYH